MKNKCLGHISCSKKQLHKCINIRIICAVSQIGYIFCVHLNEKLSLSHISNIISATNTKFHFECIILAWHYVVLKLGIHVLETTCNLIIIFLILTGGPLTITDANLCLGRLLPEYFPKIFGESQNEPLDRALAYTAFSKLTKEVGKTLISVL